MRVVHIIGGRPGPDSLNGVDRAAYFIARAQARLGLGVGLFALGGEPPVRAEGVDARVFPRAAWPFRVPAALLEALNASRPDVLHLHSPYFPEHVPLSRWARRHGVAYTVTPHGALSPGALRHRWALKVPYKYFFELPILNGAAFVHALSPHEHLEQYGVRSPIALVPNGIEPMMPPAATTRPLVTRLPEIAGKMVLLYLGRLDPLQKGLDLLVRAMARPKIVNVALVIAGPDWRGRRRWIDRAIHSSGVQASVFLTNALVDQEKRAALLEADVFVHTSRWEGMSHAVLEAAALGRPCLLTRAADPFSRLSDGGGAIVVERDADSIAEGIRRFRALSPQAMADMGRRARQAVVDEFTWERTAEELRDAYRRYSNVTSGKVST